MNDLTQSFRQLMESEKLAGVSEMHVANEKLKIQNPEMKIQDEKFEKAEGEMSLKDFEKEICLCQKCELGQTRTNFVFGETNPNADLMFVGEAPGADEDKQGRPFIGRAGQLLTKIIESIGIKREDVFIANILKCRPPGNRNPLPEEIALCSPYLLRQIDIIKPKVICALGKFAAQTLLDTETPISKLRGNFHDYHGVKLMPTYHPAYLLRNSIGKKDVWEDMKMIATELGLKIPERKDD